MTEQRDQSIRTGDISGAGIAVGHGAHAQVTITEQVRDDIKELLEQLKREIESASIPEGTKKVLEEKALPAMSAAVGESNPSSAKSGLESGIERISDHLESVGAVTSQVSGIVETVMKIAKAAGIAIKTVAPFLAGLL